MTIQKCGLAIKKTKIEQELSHKDITKHKLMKQSSSNMI